MILVENCQLYSLIRPTAFFLVDLAFSACMLAANPCNL